MVKRIGLLVVCLLISASQSYGAEWGKYLYEALTSSNTSKIRIYPASNSIPIKSLGVTSNSIYIVRCSTDMAGLVLSSNADRVGMVIMNESSVDAVYMSTYSATAAELTTYLNYGSTTPATGFYKIVKDSEFSDSIEAYTGDVYAIGTSTTIQIGVMEKY